MEGISDPPQRLVGDDEDRFAGRAPMQSRMATVDADSRSAEGSIGISGTYYYLSPMSSPAGEVAEFTAKAVVAGVLLGIVFGAANAYLGLRVGLTVSASIPAAVMTVAMFRLFRLRGTILEANLSQTIGSASTSLASGTIFTIPALFMWGL